jgi:hypothetical protein
MYRLFHCCDQLFKDGNVFKIVVTKRINSQHTRIDGNANAALR